MILAIWFVIGLILSLDIPKTYLAKRGSNPTLLFHFNLRYDGGVLAACPSLRHIVSSHCSSCRKPSPEHQQPDCEGHAARLAHHLQLAPSNSPPSRLVIITHAAWV